MPYTANSVRRGHAANSPQAAARCPATSTPILHPPSSSQPATAYSTVPTTNTATRRAARLHWDASPSPAPPPSSSTHSLHRACPPPPPARLRRPPSGAAPGSQTPPAAPPRLSPHPPRLYRLRTPRQAPCRRHRKRHHRPGAHAAALESPISYLGRVG